MYNVFTFSRHAGPVAGDLSALCSVPTDIQTTPLRFPLRSHAWFYNSLV